MTEPKPRRSLPVVRALGVALSNPTYVLGRFAVARTAYSRVRGLRRPAGSSPTIPVGDLYGDRFDAQPISSSGCIVSSRPAAEHLSRLKSDSYSGGLTLDRQAIAELRSFAERAPLVSKSGPGQYLDIQASPALLADTALATVKGSSGLDLVRRLAADDLLVDLSSRALGYHPQKVSSWLFWSFANGLDRAAREERHQTVSFHYDVDGLSFVYVSFYLVDVTDQNGAHVLVRGTHTGKKASHLLGSVRLSDEEIAETYGADRVETLTGPAGTGFIEDTSCYHKALPPLQGERLMLQFRYQ